ncbi:MAG TPA: DUF1971 domain-containing protein [Sphingomicrobium sp.]|nr:DUF1971 domain-containing protein [Sphingomicrobium sp.]
MTKPYRITPVFDEYSLPAGLRREHRTKPGVWGIIRVRKGNLRLVKMSGATILNASQPGLIEPEEPHWVEPIGPIQMQVEFYDREPQVTQN